MTSSESVAGFVVGSRASFSVKLDKRVLDRFVELTGDDNPVHVDGDYAQATSLGRPVVHGMLTAAFVSTLIGKHLPGPGALWVSQEFNFRRPVRVDETIRLSAEVTAVNTAQELLVIKVEVVNERDEIVVDGKGRVKVLARSATDQKEALKASNGGAVITGANGAVGSACAEALAKAGYPVMLVCHSARRNADRVADRILESGGRASVVCIDLSDEDDTQRLVELARGFLGSVTMLVHAAALPIDPRPVLTQRWKDVNRHLRVACEALMCMIQGFADDMANAGHGSIVAISTQALDDVPVPGWSGYLVGKAAMQMLIQSVAAELGPKGVRANLLAPGLMETSFSSDVPERARLLATQQTPLRRLCTPLDVAEAVVWLANSAPSLTGQIIRLNGGRVMR
jgi:3-oxoacyl-[acyl-carrier protein] reductase